MLGADEAASYRRGEYAGRGRASDEEATLGAEKRFSAKIGVLISLT